jgi:hypothetical protein
VSLLWAFFSFFSVTIFPIIEGRHLLWSWATDLFGKKDHGDEFDHHHHVQRRDGEKQDVGGVLGGKGGNEAAAPIDSEESSRI